MADQVQVEHYQSNKADQLRAALELEDSPFAIGVRVSKNSAALEQYGKVVLFVSPVALRAVAAEMVRIADEWDAGMEPKCRSSTTS